MTDHPLENQTNENNRLDIRFFDHLKQRCTIHETIKGSQCLVVGTNREAMYLTRGMVAELLPILTRFTETGTITETDK
jgi:hypothetical protein